MNQVPVTAVMTGICRNVSAFNQSLLSRILWILVRITRAEPQDPGPHQHLSMPHSGNKVSQIIGTAPDGEFHWMEGCLIWTWRSLTNRSVSPFWQRSYNSERAWFSMPLSAPSKSLKIPVDSLFSLYDRWDTNLASSTDPITTLGVRNPPFSRARRGSSRESSEPGLLPLRNV